MQKQVIIDDYYHYYDFLFTLKQPVIVKVMWMETLYGSSWQEEYSSSNNYDLLIIM